MIPSTATCTRLSTQHWVHTGVTLAAVILPHSPPSLPPSLLTLSAVLLPSSMDPSVIHQHFRDLRRAGVTSVAVSWWGQAHKQGSTDNQGVSTDQAVALLLSLADEHRAVSVCFHLEPYPGRSALSVLEDLQYIHDKYGHHRSLARRPDGRAVFYVYDSYHVSPADWAEIFTSAGALLRRSPPPLFCLT